MVKIKKNFDVDIDVQAFDRRILTEELGLIPASIYNKEKKTLTQHNVGFHFTNVPTVEINGTCLSSIDYKTANSLRIPKIDIIHLKLLDYFDNKDELRQFVLNVDKLTPFKLLESKKIVSNLIHVKNHYDIISLIKPSSVIEIADILGLIRPGKRKYLDLYIEDKNLGRRKIFSKENNEKYSFKKSHAVAYAHLVCLNLYGIKQGKVPLQ